MKSRRPGWWGAGLLLLVGCGTRPLDPGTAPATGGSGGDDLVATLRKIARPDQLMVVGVNGGAVTPISTQGTTYGYAQDPEALVEAAAAVKIPVCSVEFQALAMGAPTDALALPLADALDMCLKEDLQDMLARLGSLQTPSTVVVVASNTAITIHSTNNGINYFYDADIVKLLHAARKLYVPVCFVANAPLALPTPEGQSAGVSVEDALAACGRS